MSEPVPPGWYDDRSGTQTLRWWDGSQWTEHTVPLPAAPAVVNPDTAVSVPEHVSIIEPVTDHPDASASEASGRGVLPTDAAEPIPAAVASAPTMIPSRVRAVSSPPGGPQKTGTPGRTAANRIGSLAVILSLVGAVLTLFLPVFWTTPVLVAALVLAIIGLTRSSQERNTSVIALVVGIIFLIVALTGGLAHIVTNPF